MPTMDCVHPAFCLAWPAPPVPSALSAKSATMFQATRAPSALKTALPARLPQSAVHAPSVSSSTPPTTSATTVLGWAASVATCHRSAYHAPPATTSLPQGVAPSAAPLLSTAKPAPASTCVHPARSGIRWELATRAAACAPQSQAASTACP